jgi:predicted ester cyclase
MLTEEEKAKAARFVTDVVNPGRWDEINQYLDPNGVDHLVPPGFPGGSEGTKQVLPMLHAAFPDLHYKVEETLVEGDLLTQRVTGRGTMKRSLFGMPPTGKQAEWLELHIVRVKDGRMVEHWGNVDQMSMLVRLGLAPGG